jgi:K+-transporting ATPase c subunit
MRKALFWLIVLTVVGVLVWRYLALRLVSTQELPWRAGGALVIVVARALLLPSPPRAGTGQQ